MTIELDITGSRSLGLQLVASIASTKSGFTYSSHHQDWGGREWQVDIELAPRSLQGIRKLQAQLNGARADNCRAIYRPVDLRGSLAEGDSVLSETSMSAGSTSLQLAGPEEWSPQLGDYVSIGAEEPRLYQIVGDPLSLGPGSYSLVIEPPLRVELSINDEVEVRSPALTLLIDQPALTLLSYTGIGTINLSLSEAL